MDTPKPQQLLTFGNLITIGTILASGFVAWNTIETRITTQELRTQAITSELQSGAAETARWRLDIESRVRALEAALSTMRVQMDGLRDGQTEIKESLRENSNQLRGISSMLRDDGGRQP